MNSVNPRDVCEGVPYCAVYAAIVFFVPGAFVQHVFFAFVLGGMAAALFATPAPGGPASPQSGRPAAGTISIC